MTAERITAAHASAIAALLAEQNSNNSWPGKLSSSPLSTATAVCALAVFHRNAPELRPEIPPLIKAGLDWLAAHANADGGWGDTDLSWSNLSTTTLVWAAFGAVPGADERHRASVTAAEQWIRVRVGGLEPERLAPAIAALYGKDRTFSIPILTMAAIAGRLGSGAEGWRQVMQLPFELAALPARWFGAMRLPVVSYALPALIAMGQVRHHFRPTRNPLTALFRAATRQRTLRILTRIQPCNGGFLEATPLTAFVTMSLAAMRLTPHPVTQRGIEFLIRSARSDGSWPIDTNLATWLTTLSVNALGGVEGSLPKPDAARIRSWLLAQQTGAIHPFTRAAPGAWAWTDLPGGVPDADDTAGALLALRRLGPPDLATRRAAVAGVRWLCEVQNRDGGIPTFCKGWGSLPFDRSSPDITAHTLRAWVEWQEDLATSSNARAAKPLEKAIGRALGFLASTQRPDGSWIPLWFGHQEAPDEANPVYGTTRVLLALQTVAARNRWPKAEPMAAAAQHWLLAVQNPDGGWTSAPGAASSVEETALAVEALAGSVRSEAVTSALERGACWLAARVESGEWRQPSPIGFYFARLWYYERLYPLIFTVAALRTWNHPVHPEG